MMLSALLCKRRAPLKNQQVFHGSLYPAGEADSRHLQSQQQGRRSAPALQRQEGGLRRPIPGTPASGVHSEGLLPRKGFPSSPDCARMSVFDLKGFCLWGKHTSQKAYTLDLKSGFPESGYEQGLGQDSVHVPSLDQDSDRAAWKSTRMEGFLSVHVGCPEVPQPGTRQTP